MSSLRYRWKSPPAEAIRGCKGGCGVRTLYFTAGCFMKPGLDREQWLAALAQISRHLDRSGPPMCLCLIGSVACVFGGMITHFPGYRRLEAGE